MDHYRYAVDRINLWQSEIQKQTKEAKRQQVNSPATVGLMQMPTLELQQKLLSLVSGNMSIAQRLIDIAKQDHPNMPKVWYWQKVVFDIAVAPHQRLCGESFQFFVGYLFWASR